jgi:hypothetical protein
MAEIGLSFRRSLRATKIRFCQTADVPTFKAKLTSDWAPNNGISTLFVWTIERVYSLAGATFGKSASTCEGAEVFPERRALFKYIFLLLL